MPHPRKEHLSPSMPICRSKAGVMTKAEDGMQELQEASAICK
jgi:hypothetical protein